MIWTITLTSWIWAFDVTSASIQIQHWCIHRQGQGRQNSHDEAVGSRSPEASWCLSWKLCAMLCRMLANNPCRLPSRSLLRSPERRLCLDAHAVDTTTIIHVDDGSNIRMTTPLKRVPTLLLYCNYCIYNLVSILARGRERRGEGERREEGEEKETMRNEIWDRFKSTQNFQLTEVHDAAHLLTSLDVDVVCIFLFFFFLLLRQSFFFLLRPAHH